MDDGVSVSVLSSKWSEACNPFSHTIKIRLQFQQDFSTLRPHLHLSLNHGGCWGTTDEFTTSFLHFSWFPSGLLDLANSRPVHSLILSSHLFFCLPCLPTFTVLCKMVLARSDEQETCPSTSVCISLGWSGGLRLVWLPAESWHRQALMMPLLTSKQWLI